MKLDAELMFECLIYLNAYYYPIFATCQSIMTAAKYRSFIDTPSILQDASVVFTVLASELAKILLYKKYKEDNRDFITSVCVVLTCISIAGVLYTFLIQYPVLKLEHILCTLEITLAITQVLFGVLQIMPCCKKVQYY